MAGERYANRTIVCFDRFHERHQVAYQDLILPFGEDREVSLAEYLDLEAERVWELRRNSRRIGPRLAALDGIYAQHELPPDGMVDVWDWRTRGIHKMAFQERLHALDNYYVIPRTEHGRILDEVMAYMMEGSEGDHSAYELSLIRFSLDFTLWSLRGSRRKTGVPTAFHSVELARGIAKNGQNAITIMGALLHDVLEEILDWYTDALVKGAVDADPALSARVEARGGKLSEPERNAILQANLEAYNDRASGIYYSIGLFLFYHVRMFPHPERYYQFLNSLMAVVANLSRTKDTSYFRYVQRFLFPKEPRPDPIRRADLIAAIAPYFPKPGEILQEYLTKVEGFYTTAWGTFTSAEELQRNAFREILCKIMDRLNNTRDLERHYFTASARLYGAGFKNLYIVQAIQDKMRKNKRMRSDERRLIDVKFLDKPKVAALYQMLEEIEYLGRILGQDKIEALERYLDDDYKASRAFREVRKARPGVATGENTFDGTVEFFTAVVLGDKGRLADVDQDLELAARFAVVFRSLFEAFLVYPVMADKARREAQACNPPVEPRFDDFHITGLNFHLDEAVKVAAHESARFLKLRTFRRELVD
jgi:hypothetical protein